MGQQRTAPFGFGDVVFLSHVVDGGAPVFPGDPAVELRTAATVERDGYYLQQLATGEQSGTHWAAPAHFNEGQAAADELAPCDFFYPAAVLDVRAAAATDADFTLGVADVQRWEAEFGRIPGRAAVIMWTGFADRWPDPAAYLNADAAGQPHYPGFGVAATRWLIANRGAGALGIDTMGIDPGTDHAFGSNRLLLRDHRIHLENLAGLGQLPPLGAWVIVGGLRTRAGSGSPATIFGLIP
ncbi:MAG TPA: cyclase family protein [Streptosporangiaceae bacterium]